MANITYWVDPVDGNDADSGLSFADAVETIDGAIARIVSAGNGNDFTVNLVNTADHLQRDQNRQQIDNHTTSTFLIRGTDPSGNPAKAIIRPETTATTAAAKAAFYIRENAGIIFEYIRWDCTSVSAATNTIVFLTTRDNQSSYITRFRYMEIIGADLLNTPAGVRVIVQDDTTSETNKGQHAIEYSYIQNMTQLYASNVIKHIVHDCVVVYDGLVSPATIILMAAGNNPTSEFYNNTVYVIDRNTVNFSALANGIFRVNSSSSTYAKLHAYNNLVFIDTNEDVTAETPGNLAPFLSVEPSSSTVTDEDIRFNVAIVGPLLAQIDTGNTVVQYYDSFWDTPFVGDVFTHGQDAAEVFTDINETYAWTPEGSSIELTINRDLRPIDYVDAGVGGEPPGALEAGATTGTITVSAEPQLATWSISGAASYTGVGSTTIPNVPAGDYTITWNSVENYRTPQSVSGSVAILETLEFSVEYQLSTVAFLYSDASSPSLNITNDNVLAKFDLADTSNWFDYEFVVWSGTEVLSIHSILSVTSTTAATIFQVTGEPDITTAGLMYAMSPTRSAKENFFTKYPYEHALIEGSTNRTNIWPSHSAITDLLLFEGNEYRSFVDTELARGLSADTVGASPPTNVMWRKLVPAGIKSLDNDDQILQKLVLVLGMSFDKIRLYQEQLSYAHTIGYEDYNHVPRSLVTELAKLWGWSLSHDSKNNDLTTYNLSIYDHYASGMTDAVGNLSSSDINFERWRRIVSNLVRIWKAKGTRKAIELVLDVYGIPSELLVIKEYVYFVDPQIAQFSHLREIPTGIFVTTGSTQTRVWIDPDDGSAQTIQNKPIYNVKYLDIGVSDTEAIVNDVFSWASTTDQTFIDVNGVSISLSGYTGSKYDFEQHLINLFIPSDGSHRTADEYNKLQSVYSSYLSNSANAYTYGDFNQFIEFIEENFNDIVKQLVPASSRLLAQGNIVQNLPFHRQKYVWEPEDDVAQPFNGEKTWTYPTLSGNRQSKVTATVNPVDTIAEKKIQLDAELDTNLVVSSMKQVVDTSVSPLGLSTEKSLQYFANIDTVETMSERIPQLEDVHILDEISSGQFFNIDTPEIIAYSADSGSSDFTAFSTSALIVTNDNIFDLYLSASNMSVSGANQIVVELFRKLDDDEIENIRSSAFTIQQTIYEGSQFTPTSARFGTYRLSSIQGLSIGDVLDVESNLAPFINTRVGIVNVFSDTNKITTTPPIGLDNLPVGKNAANIGLRTFFSSEVVVWLIKIIEEERIPHNIIMDIVNYLYSELPPIKSRNIAHLKMFNDYLSKLSTTSGISIQTLHGAFNKFYQFTTTDLAGIAIAVPFLRDNPNFQLSSDRLFISDVLISRLAAVTLRKSNQYFDWANPVSSTVLSQSNQGSFTSWPSDPNLEGITSANTRVISGSTEIGGLDDLNAPILRDREEYFIRWRADAEVPAAFTGETYFDVIDERNVISSNFELQVINDLYYYGNYFVHMKTSKEPVFTTIPETYNSTPTGRTTTASVEIQFRGVADSDRLDLEFLPDGPAPDYDDPTAGPSQLTESYTSFTDTNWATATTISIDVKPNADDRTVYAVQTTLNPNTWYWWRVRNGKQKLTMFGYVLQSVTHSEPKLFFTGDFKDTAAEEGINPDTPEPPDADPTPPPGPKTPIFGN